MSKKQKRIISVEVETITPYEFDNTLGNLKSYISDLVTKYGVDARMEWDGDYWPQYSDSPSPRFEVKIMREETDAEYNKRVAQEEKDQSAREAHERKEFERLQAKFGAK